MKIKVNNKEMELPEDSSLQQVAQTLALPEHGVAMAVNNRMEQPHGPACRMANVYCSRKRFVGCYQSGMWRISLMLRS